MMIGKKHLVLAGLLIALGAAVYLNWQFAPTDTVIDTTGTADSVYAGDEYITVSTHTLSETDIPASTDETDAIEAAVTKSTFDETREERQSTREDALETLQEIIEDASIDDAQKTEAVNTAAQIAERMDTEAAIEMLIKAKGFKDCVVVISDSQINVIVPAEEGGIKASDAAIVRDIVVGQTDISPSCIKIIESK